jgi:2'-hydroxyisoflavone reductase
LFNRGKTNPDLFPEAIRIQGDRDGGLDSLSGHAWDAVIDINGYFPRLVKDSVDALKGTAPYYLFISTVSVYDEFAEPGVSEDHTLATLPDSTVEEITGETYGPLKVLCEQHVTSAYGDNACIVRPGLIVGPHDPTDRFTYWPLRATRGSEILAPGEPERFVQFIDARDLANLVVTLTEGVRGGVFNAVGPSGPITFGELLQICAVNAGVEHVPVWATDAFLLEHELRPFFDLPLWIPNTPDKAGFSQISNAAAIQAGLVTRPVAETVHDTLEWYQKLPEKPTFRAGLTEDQEVELLKKWTARSQEA